MGKIVLGTTMSLDGFINDRHGDVGVLYSALADQGMTEVIQESIHSTGAVVIGRRMFDMGDPDSFADSYEFQVPIFVVTHTPPAEAPRQNDRLTFTFVTEGVESALRQAQAAAGDKDVTVIGGVDVARQCLQTGLVDELDLAIVPVLLGDGLRFFDRDSVEGIELGSPRVRQAGGVTLLTFPIVSKKKG